MFFANNVRGERTHISSAKSDDKYYCPACGNLMIQKHGNINAHHFAHKSCGCCDPCTLESYLFGMQKCRASSENLHKK